MREKDCSDSVSPLGLLLKRLSMRELDDVRLYKAV